MVYPGALHSRFQHSLGVYWLASEAIGRLKTYQGLELGIDRFHTQTVKIAGLLHDLGHGPFSHMFEHEFILRVLHGLKWSHEEMSLKMIDYIGTSAISNPAFTSDEVYEKILDLQDKVASVNRIVWY